jgi:hypothetical protein
MRLGQLARKLALRPAEIVEILAGHQIQVVEDQNVKLDKAHLILVLQRFSPELQKEILNEDRLIEEVKLPEQSVVEEPPALIQEIPPVSSEEPPVEKPEVIKAPKVELSGLKVLGKIEIPEPKKKTVEPSPETENTPLEQGKDNRPERREQQPYRGNRGSQRPRKNPIALEREKEALEAQQKKEEQARLQKEKRTQNYLKKVKTPAPIKATRLVKEEVMEMSAAELKEPPKTLWGKFVKWLTT